MKKHLKGASILLCFLLLFQGIIFPLYSPNNSVMAKAKTTKIASSENAPNKDTEPPSTPQNLTFQNKSIDQVTLSWDSSTDNNAVKGYIIYRDDQELATVMDSVSYTDTGLLSGTTYKYEVAAFDKSNNLSSKSEALMVTTDPMINGNGTGLYGEYYNGIDFSDIQFHRYDSVIDFDWGSRSPDNKLDPKSFSVSWTGKIEPRFSEDYTFYTEANGGVRLWINNQLLVDDLDAHYMSKDGSTISLISGVQYDIQMEYRETNGVSAVKLLWSSKSQPIEIVPQSQLYPPVIPEIPSNINIVTTSNTISLNWDKVSNAIGYELEVDGVTLDNGDQSTFTHTDLLPSTEHIYRIKSKGMIVDSDWSQPFIAKTKISVPTNLHATKKDGKVVIHWDDVVGALGYEIEVDGAIINTQTNNFYEHLEILPDIQHIYIVRTRGEDGYSDWSETITYIVSVSIPENITTIPSSTSITISWNNVISATGYEIEVDGNVIDNGLGTIFIHNGLTPNSKHTYRVRIKEENNVGQWSAPITVSTLTEPDTGNGIGLRGEYFDNEDLTDSKSSRIDETINFDWKNDSPAPGIEDPIFSVRWSGQIEPRYSENYTFYTVAHGGIRLWINNQLLIDDWDAHNMSKNSGCIQLESKKHYDIKVEYRETNGVALAEMYWESKSQSKQIVPIGALYPMGMVQNITSTSTETTISLDWEPVFSAISYEIEIDGEMIESSAETNFVHSNLLSGTRHSYRIRATNGVAIGEWSNSITETTKLGMPNLSGTESTETSILLGWESVSGATSYDVEVDGTLLNNGSQSSYLHNELFSGTEHFYRIRAKSQVATSEWTSLIHVWTLPDVPVVHTVNSTSTSVTLMWDEIRGATGYEIEINNMVVDNGDSTTFTENNLNPNTQRTYKVRAKNSGGVGKWSSLIAKTTLPGVPKNLKGSATESSILVSWDSVAGATAYDLEIDGVLVENLTETTYTHNELISNTHHQYKVRAKNQSGISKWSESVELITLLTTPLNIKIISTNNEITLSWDEVIGATGYDVEVDGKVVDNGAITNYIHSGLKTNSEHLYRIRAKNNLVISNWSEGVSKITLLGIPLNLKGVSSSTEITINWDMVVGATSYEIEVDGQIFSNELNTSFTHSGLLPNNNHSYRVRAINLGGTGDWSELITLTTIFGIPTNLVATATDSSITVGWDKVSGATEYDIFIDSEIINLGDQTTYKHIGLEPYTYHVYKVRAKSSTITGEWSDPITQVTILGTPANTKIETFSSQIKISWDQVKGAEEYDIEVDGLIVENGFSNTYLHAGLSPNTEHTYRIRAKNENVYSNWSQYLVGKTPPSPPQNIITTALTNSITLTWDPVQAATDYEIEIDGKKIERVTKSNYTHIELKPNTLHFYRVRTLNENGSSEWSEKVEETTIPELEVNIGKDNLFNFVFVVPQKIDESTRKVIVTYNPNELELQDLSALTPERNLSVGPIPGTKIVVTEMTPGRIVYLVQNADKTIVNSIKFMAKVNQYTKISYVIE